ncbi:type-1 angiotensin II receptor-associated protein-like [Asterias amurensis]|uniref:type-1 angiotensin II receptor-associated protein-like n=1 Tax=Asterias amurensis TaxID=7602 RepID=UPI003AB66B81
MSSPMNLPISSIMDKWALKVIVATHFLLTVWALLASNFLPSGYLYMNTIITLTGLWSIAMQDNKDSVQMFFIFHLISILTDIIFLGVMFGPAQTKYCQDGNQRCSDFRFSAGMAIINLLIKPLSACFLFMELRRRGGIYTSFPGNPGSSGYENIDQPIPTNQQVEAAQPHQSAMERPYLPQ